MMKIEIKNDRAMVYTPYNPIFVANIKKIGGAKWNGEEKCWTVPANAVDVVREIMLETYGYNDITKNETISLKITVNELIRCDKSDVVLFGKVIAYATGRDSGARVGDDAAFISGGAKSGGSFKNWYTEIESGSVIILNNVNKTIYEKTTIPPEINVEIIEKQPDKGQLLDEKERLLKRLAEIDKILGDIG